MGAWSLHSIIRDPVDTECDAIVTDSRTELTAGNTARFPLGRLTDHRVLPAANFSQACRVLHRLACACATMIPTNGAHFTTRYILHRWAAANCSSSVRGWG